MFVKHHCFIRAAKALDTGYFLSKMLFCSTLLGCPWSIGMLLLAASEVPQACSATAAAIAQ